MKMAVFGEKTKKQPKAALAANKCPEGLETKSAVGDGAFERPSESFSLAFQKKQNAKKNNSPEASRGLAEILRKTRKSACKRPERPRYFHKG
jgi:hypothetical protein